MPGSHTREISSRVLRAEERAGQSGDPGAGGLTLAGAGCSRGGGRCTGSGRRRSAALVPPSARPHLKRRSHTRVPRWTSRLDSGHGRPGARTLGKWGGDDAGTGRAAAGAPGRQGTSAPRGARGCSTAGLRDGQGHADTRGCSGCTRESRGTANPPCCSPAQAPTPRLRKYRESHSQAGPESGRITLINVDIIFQAPCQGSTGTATVMEAAWNPSQTVGS